jgi:hypothetical protein
MLEKNIKKLKKDELIKINEFHGYKYDKKTKNKVLIENLLKIYRIKNIIENINLNIEECPICLNELNKFNYIFTKCGHFFCKECIFIYITNEQEICPLCRDNYTYDDFINSITPLEMNILLCIIFSKKIYKSKNFYKNFYTKYLYISIILLFKLILLFKCIKFLYGLLNNKNI